MVERQHGVRFPAPEVRLKLNDRIAAYVGQALNGTDKELLQAVGQIGGILPPNLLPILIRSFADVDLPQICRKFRLLIATARHILVRIHHLTPWRETAFPTDFR